MDLEQVSEADLGDVSAFLCEVFGLKQPTRTLQPDVLRWKYFAPHPYWEGSRSYCIRLDHQIVAHGCVVPSRMLAGDRVASSCLVIDWAGSPKMPGAGALICQRLYATADTFLGIGGTEAARRIMPKLGCKTHGELEVFVRVVRPMRDFGARPKSNWKSGAHLARNTVRLLLRPRLSTTKGWSARRVDHFDESVDPVLPRSSEYVVCQRTPELLNYLLACPASQVRGYTLHAGGSLKGYCLLSHFENRCHIADLSSDVTSNDLPQAYAVALEMAAAPSDVSEVIATASTPRVREALVAAGFHRREGMPIFLRDPKGMVAGRGPLNITSVENDFFYL